MQNPKYMRDPLKSLILEQKTLRHLTSEDIAKMGLISKATYYRYMNLHTSQWLTEAFRICIALDLSVDEIKSSITYYKRRDKK